MKRWILYIVMLVIPLMEWGCALLASQEGGGIYNDSYYTQADAARDRARRAEEEALLAKLRAEEARLAEAREATRLAEEETQLAQTQREESSRVLGPNDFDSYAEYRAYVDGLDGHSIRRGEENYAGDYQAQTYRETSRRGDGYELESSRRAEPVIINNYYGYDDLWWDRPSSLFLLSFDPWYYPAYSYRRHRAYYDPFWPAPYYGYWHADLYSPWWYSPSPWGRYGWGYYGATGYHAGYHDGLVAGLYSGNRWGSSPYKGRGYRRGVVRTSRSQSASMGGYGRTQRSIAARTATTHGSRARGRVTTTRTPNYSRGTSTRRWGSSDRGVMTRGNQSTRVNTRNQSSSTYRSPRGGDTRSYNPGATRSGRSGTTYRSTGTSTRSRSSNSSYRTPTTGRSSNTSTSTRARSSTTSNVRSSTTSSTPSTTSSNSSNSGNSGTTTRKSTRTR